MTAEDDDTVAIGDTLVDAQRYRLSAKAGDITLWYAKDDGRWLALEAPAKGGRRIHYTPVAVPPAQAFEQLVARRN